MSELKELRIGVIGTGSRGVHLAKLANNPGDGVRLVAGTDISQESLDAFKRTLGSDVITTTDYRVLLANGSLDAVFVTSPDFLHEEHAVAALEAGKDVYLEKPMAITIEGCDRIMRAACQGKRKLYLGHNMRHMDVFLKMKEFIDKGTVGEVKAGWCRHFVGYGGDAFFKDWHAERAKSTGLFLQKGAHDIDVLHWLCGGDTKRVSGMGGMTLYDRITDRHDSSDIGDSASCLENWPPLSQKGLNPIIDVEDLSMMLMALDNGVFASYQQCHYAPDAWRNYTIIGTEGRIENFGDAPGETIIKIWNNRCYYKNEGDMEYFVPEAEGSHGGADTRIVNEFIEYIRSGKEIATSPIAARYSVAAGYLATQSLRNNSQPYDVPLVEPALMTYFRVD